MAVILHLQSLQTQIYERGPPKRNIPSTNLMSF